VGLTRPVTAHLAAIGTGQHRSPGPVRLPLQARCCLGTGGTTRCTSPGRAALAGYRRGRTPAGSPAVPPERSTARRIPDRLIRALYTIRRPAAVAIVAGL